VHRLLHLIGTYGARIFLYLHVSIRHVLFGIFRCLLRSLRVFITFIIQTQKALAQVVAHDREVYDVSFGSADEFATVSAGIVTMMRNIGFVMC